MELTIELVLAIIVAILAIALLARSRAQDLGAWALLLLAAIHIIPLVSA